MGSVKYPQLKIGVKRELFLIAVFVLILAVGAYVFVTYEQKGLWDAVYETLCNVSWAECSKSVIPEVRSMSLVLALTTWLLFAAIMGFIVEKIMNIEFGGRLMKQKISKMRGHIIVCGYGDLGKTASEIFRSEGQDIVIVEANDKEVQTLKDQKVPFVQGDALHAETLKKAGVDRAKLLVGALGNDSDNVFLALTAREANKKIRIATRCYSESSAGKLHSAGADIIVMPEIIGGFELAKEALNVPFHKIKEISKKRPVIVYERTTGEERKTAR